MKKQILILVFLLTALFNVFAQTPQPVQDFASHPRVFTKRYSFWTEYNLNGSITEDKKWQYSFDYQYRRMADASYIKNGAHANIFKDPFQQVFRPWIHYWIKPGAVRLSLSPIGYWITWTPPRDASLYTNIDNATGRLSFPEFRTCPQITFISKVGRLEIQNRYRYEFRWLGQRHKSDNVISDFGDGYSFGPSGPYGSAHRGRLRYMLRFNLPLNNTKIDKNTWYLTAWDELFLNIGRHIPNNKLLDQNRTIVMLGYKFKSEVPIRLEVGYTLQQVYKFDINTPPTQPNVTYGKNNVELNNALQFYVIFEEFHKLFKKREPKVEQVQ